MKQLPVDLKSLTARFEAPCLLPLQKRLMWTQPHRVRPALVKATFGNADLLLALSPVMHRPHFYLVWIDARWHGEEELHRHLDAIYDAIAEEFGMRADDEQPYRWPEEDFAAGAAWWVADADDVLTARRRKLLQA